MATLALRWNVFDTVIIAVSLVLQVYKVLNDYVVVKAPHPPVMTFQDYPLECQAFLAEQAQAGQGAKTASRAATGSRLLSRFAVMVRLMRAFFKVAAQRRYAQYLARSSLADLCAAGVLEDVENRLLDRPWELGQPDEYGLYPIHYAAMNEHETAPDILEAILLTNRFAAQQRDRLGSLALHYACRNRGPTLRQDTALKLHTSMEPCVHRMVRLLLNESNGYAKGASVPDMDGKLPLDYVLENPNNSKQSTVRALKMLLYVNPDAASLTVHKSELDFEGGAKLYVSKQCPGYNWHRLSKAYGKPLVKAAGKVLQGMPVGFGHDGRGRAVQDQSSERLQGDVLRKDLMQMSAQSTYTKVFFKEWHRVCLDRLGLKRVVTATTNLIKLDKERAFGRAPALIEELNGVTQRIVDKCLKLQTADDQTKHILRWFSMSGTEADDCETLRYALALEDETWNPVHKLRRVIDDLRQALLDGRRGLFFNLPHDTLLAMERHPLHEVMQNESAVAPDMANVLLDGPARQNLRAAVRVLDGLRRTPLQWSAQNRGPKASTLLASILAVERAVTPGNRDFAGRFALHTAVANPSPEAGDLVRRLVKVNAGAARAEDGFGHLPVELAFVSRSPAVGMVIACITTAFPDGALCEGGADGNTVPPAL